MTLLFPPSCAQSLVAETPQQPAIMDMKKDSAFPEPDLRDVMPDPLSPDVSPNNVSEKLGTDWDQRGMARIGKKQELRREFHFFSITGYAMILGCSWEFALM